MLLCDKLWPNIMETKSGLKSVEEGCREKREHLKHESGKEIKGYTRTLEERL